MNGIEKRPPVNTDDEQKMSKNSGTQSFWDHLDVFTLRSDQDNRSVGCLWNRGIYL